MRRLDQQNGRAMRAPSQEGTAEMRPQDKNTDMTMRWMR